MFVSPVSINTNYRIKSIKSANNAQSLTTAPKSIPFGELSLKTSTLENNYLLTSDKTRLGANYNPVSNKVDFKLASKNAQSVILCIFDEPKGQEPKLNIPMKKIANSNIWKTSVSADLLNAKTKPVYYGYRVFGSNWQRGEDFFNDDFSIKDPKSGFNSIVDENNARFNPNKIAFDPYSRELSHIPSDNKDGMDAYFSNEGCFEDNAKFASKSVFTINQDTIIPKVNQDP